VSDTLLISLPELPPSVNASREIHKRGTQRFIGSTSRYRDWIEANKWAVAEQRKGRAVLGPVEVEIIATLPSKGVHPDLDNLLKPALDALAKGGAIENDRLVEKLTASWATNAIPGMSILVRSPVAGLAKRRAA